MATNNYNTLLQGTVTISSAYQNRLVCNVTLHLFLTLLNEFECNSNIQYIFAISIEVYIIIIYLHTSHSINSIYLVLCDDIFLSVVFYLPYTSNVCICSILMAGTLH